MDDMKTPSFDMDWADRAEALAHEIYTWCIKNDCWQDVYIYYNGKRMGTSGEDKTGKTVYRYGGIHDTGKNALTVADYCQLIAECAFENEVGNNSISEVMDWNHCVDFQRGYMLSQ